ncbi:MAG: cysteine--tRNA ligase [Bdellovibrionales bacterium]|nr:cysteine--tRNA ligase [Bdellovibrionales bacterium]
MSLPEIKVFNTLSGKRETLQTLQPGRVNIYACGPTVYGLTHVGNARTSLFGDLVVRVLKYAGYEVRYARNITDVDDKIIKLANETGRTSQAVAEFFTEAYANEQKQIRNLTPSIMPKATEYIAEMIEMSRGLIEKGTAYAAETPFGQDVYFRVKQFASYGKLSKRKTDDLLAGTRIEPGETKEDPLDFALWKAAKPGEPSWESPWGEGRPGWHIECSAMIHKCFPEGLDIHMGGLDLIFPHHENEIAQSEALTGKPLAPYWLHGGMLTFAREKMSKSLGNIVTTQKFLEEYGPEVLRLMMYQNHYRGPLDFTEEVILRTEGLLTRLYTAKLKFVESYGATGDVTQPELKSLKHDMDQALFDDFGSAKALGLALKGIRSCFKDAAPANWLAWGEGLKTLEQALGLVSEEPLQALANIKARRLKRMGVTEEFSAQIESQLKNREEARAQKNFAESDRLRQELEKQGIQVMDGPDGSTWSMAPRA